MNNPLKTIESPVATDSSMDTASHTSEEPHDNDDVFVGEQPWQIQDAEAGVIVPKAPEELQQQPKDDAGPNKKNCLWNSRFCQRLVLEKELLQRSWKLWVFGLFFQYVHSIATNLVYYLHEPAGEPLKDLGFELLSPPLAEGDQWISEVVFFTLVAILIVFALQPLLVVSYHEPPRFVATMATRYLRVLVLAQTLRILSFLSTILPSPNFHCLESGADEYDPPQTALEIFTRLDLFHGCGDLIFSSHTIFVTLGGLMVHHYSRNVYLKATVWSLVVALGFLIVAARKHYTVDVTVAWYTCPLLWFYCAQKFPDNVPPSIVDRAKRMDEQAENLNQHDDNKAMDPTISEAQSHSIVELELGSS